MILPNSAGGYGLRWIPRLDDATTRQLSRSSITILYLWTSKSANILAMRAAIRAQILTDFPIEVLVSMLHHCHYITILRFSMTCRKAYKVLRESISLQLHIELEVNGLEIASIDQSSNAGPDYRSILRELKGYQDAWVNLRFEPEPIKHLSRLEGHRLHKLRHQTHFGAFYQPTHENDGASRYSGPFDHIQIAKLDSLAAPIALRFSKFHKFTVDPKQDLIILVEYDTWFALL
ncbi:unnamed protein product [Rhizoctonia solani]|uniref:F-box domain-containing protein n=1 Tax=Rhizoctonia solani TaxID=456999 RepID=A0A8H3CRV9_9AGAM|nr:unnamed protein product [Rhizoctonia solani]